MSSDNNTSRSHARRLALLGGALAVLAAATIVRRTAVDVVPAAPGARPAAARPVSAVPAPAPAPAPAQGGKALLSERAPIAVLPEILLAPRSGVSPADIAARFGLTARPPDPQLARIGYAVLDVPPGARARLAEIVAAIRASGLAAAADPNLVSRGTGCCEGEEREPAGETPIPGLERAWAETHGSRDVLVAVLDTGCDLRHPDLAENLVAGRDFVRDGERPEDDNGHGTAITGVIGAIGGNGRGTAGVAWAVSILPVKVADADGEATLADLARGLVYAADRGARVIVVALGSETGSGALASAVRYAASKGALIIAAAGNAGVNHELFPAAYEECLSVGAAGPGDELAFRTALASGIDLYAPGEGLPTTFLHGTYCRVSGTSAAAAYAAGVAALLLAKEPSLDAAALAQALREGGRPIPALARAASVFPARRLHAELALGRARPVFEDLAVEEVGASPRRPLSGGSAVLRARVRNASSRPIAGAEVAFTLGGLPAGSAACPLLGPGERAEVEVAIRVPRASALLDARPLALAARVSAPIRDEDATNDEARGALEIARRAEPELEVAAIDLTLLDAVRAEARFRVRLENRGSAGAAVALEARDAQGAAEVLEAPERLAAGAGGEAIVSVRLAEGAPRRVDRLEVAVRAAGAAGPAGERARAAFEWSIRPLDPRPAKLQYQQAGEVDLIGDAPWRVAPGRPYVPVLIYVPCKGDDDPSKALTLLATRLVVRQDPLALSGTTIYDESSSVDITPLASRRPAGLEILDEEGRPIYDARGRLDANLFGDRKIYEAGHYAILRVPRAAFGVAAAAAERYLDLSIEWSAERTVFWFFTSTRTGTYRKTMRIVFADKDLAKLPGEGRGYDAHFHSIAEWWTSSAFDPLSPRKNYGGPIPMLREVSYALGLVDSPDDLYEKVITTDHSCFYNRLEPGSDSPERRPPFGPTSPASSRDTYGVVLGELERMRELFGVTVGEEVCFSQPQTWGIVPIGAHMLSFRGEHIEGPWHGGSTLAQTFGDPRIVELGPLLARLARTNPAANARAFAYAAHPYDSGIKWHPTNLDLGCGLGQSAGAVDATTLADDEFVFKGLQLWSGRAARALPTNRIDFQAVDPFRDPDWRAGDIAWDAELERGLADWHTRLAALLEYRLLNRPGARFPRKLYIAGGTDAHGDFNICEDRLATNIGLASTFRVTSNAFATVRTYTFSEGKPGATPGERAMEALSEGNTVVTDGPLVDVAFDAEGRFDSQSLVWHDRTSRFEDRDGSIGGAGAYDGGRTALVVKGNREAFFGYRYADSNEGGTDDGAVRFLKIYRDRPGDPTPVRTRRTPSGGTFEQPVAVGSLAPSQAGADLAERLDPAEEGLVTVPTAFSIGAFTGRVDPDQGDIAPEERRAYTNPIWVVPVEVNVQIGTVDAARGVIPAGGLAVRYTFAASMKPLRYAIEVQALDPQGRSAGKAGGAITRMVPARSGATGWSAAGGAIDSVLDVVNERPIPLNVDRYPGPQDVTFVIYFRDPPQDCHGNALNPVATTFTTQGIGTGGGSGVVAPAATPGAGGSSSGGGCAAAAGGEAMPALLPYLALAGLLGLARRALRRGAGKGAGDRGRHSASRAGTHGRARDEAAPPVLEG